MFDTILFDLDGTLTDPGEGITNSVAYAMKKYDIEVSDRCELYKFIGPPLKDSFMKYYGFSEDKAVEAIAFYCFLRLQRGGNRFLRRYRYALRLLVRCYPNDGC